jgi:hypothetical protein
MATNKSKVNKEEVKKKSTKKVAKKTKVAKKAAPKKAIPRATKSSTTSKPKKQIPPDERLEMIRTAAYYLAEKRGYQGNNELGDWLEAEQEIESLST